MVMADPPSAAASDLRSEVVAFAGTMTLLPMKPRSRYAKELFADDKEHVRACFSFIPIIASPLLFSLRKSETDTSDQSRAST